MKRYKPTKKDRLRLKTHPDFLKVSGDKVFVSLQGEGITSGQPAVFLRLHFCNLECCWCDTKYTWDKTRREFWREPEDWSYLDSATKIKIAWMEKFGSEITKTKKRVVITGGEPLLQQSKIIKFLEFLPGWNVEIETNGTITPLPELHQRQINCSPKLGNSRNSKERRYKPKVLKLINSFLNSWFKFVVTNEIDLDEVDQIAQECSLDSEKILIMPEGHTKESVSTRMELIRSAVKSRGWKIIPRNQLIWFGNKRKT